VLQANPWDGIGKMTRAWEVTPFGRLTKPLDRFLAVNRRPRVLGEERRCPADQECAGDDGSSLLGVSASRAKR